LVNENPFCWEEKIFVEGESCERCRSIFLRSDRILGREVGNDQFSCLDM